MGSASGEIIPWPDEYLCPIGKEPMVDPVITVDGHTYERQNIEYWFERSNKSPKTNLPLQRLSVRENIALHQTIEAFKERRPEEIRMRLSQKELEKRFKELQEQLTKETKRVQKLKLQQQVTEEIEEQRRYALRRRKLAEKEKVIALCARPKKRAGGADPKPKLAGMQVVQGKRPVENDTQPPLERARVLGGGCYTQPFSDSMKPMMTLACPSDTADYINGALGKEIFSRTSVKIELSDLYIQKDVVERTFKTSTKAVHLFGAHKQCQCAITILQEEIVTGWLRKIHPAPRLPFHLQGKKTPPTTSTQQLNSILFKC